MKVLAITPTIVNFIKYKEVRSCLDVEIVKFFYDSGYSSFILPHNIPNTEVLLNNIKIDGIVLSGGNDLCEYGGKYTFRDDNEILLIKYAIVNNIPLLGICRGMQIILHYFGIKLFTIKGHERTSHQVVLNNETTWVNSFHKFAAIFEEDENFKILAKSMDGAVEAIKSKKHLIYGIMWHPERNNYFQDSDKKLINQIFK